MRPLVLNMNLVPVVKMLSVAVYMWVSVTFYSTEPSEIRRTRSSPWMTRAQAEWSACKLYCQRSGSINTIGMKTAR